jgi:hypothetical protein
VETAELASYGLQGVVSQTIGLFLTTAAKTSNPSIQIVQVASHVLNGRSEVILQSHPVLLGVVKQPEGRGFQTR